MLGLFAWRPVQAQGALGPGYYDNDFFMLSYSGTWVANEAAANCIDGDRARATTPSDSVAFDMWGDGFTFHTQMRSQTDASFNACINSVCQNLSTYGGGGSGPLSFDFTDLGYGVHEVELIQVAQQFDVCAIVVHPPAPQPTQPPQEIVVELTFVPVQPTIVVPQQPIDYRHLWTINDQVVAFDYQVSAGDVSLMMFLAVVSLFLFVAALIYLLRRPAQ